MAAAFDADDALADIVASYPPGHFNDVTGLLHSYVELLAEHAALLDESHAFLEAAKFNSLAERVVQLGKAMEIHQMATVALSDAVDLAAALGLLPGDDRTRRPCLQ